MVISNSAVSLGQARVQLCAPMVRSRENSKRGILSIDVLQVDQHGDLRRTSTKAHVVVPAPPVLMPGERGAERILDADVAGDPSQIIATDCSSYAIESATVSEGGADHRIIEAQRHESVVR